MLPQSKLQDVFFTAFMAFVMVYAMICYNISLNVGGLQNFVFLAAFKEMIIMWPIAVALELLFVGKLALCRQVFFAGPLVRNVFGLIMRALGKGRENYEESDLQCRIRYRSF